MLAIEPWHLRSIRRFRARRIDFKIVSSLVIPSDDGLGIVELLSERGPELRSIDKQRWTDKRKAGVKLWSGRW